MGENGFGQLGVGDIIDIFFNTTPKAVGAIPTTATTKHIDTNAIGTVFLTDSGDAYYTGRTRY